MKKTEKMSHFHCYLFGSLGYSSKHTHTHTHSLARNLYKIPGFTSTYGFLYPALRGISFPYTLLYSDVHRHGFRPGGAGSRVPMCHAGEC